jgi:hypothetical protein
VSLLLALPTQSSLAFSVTISCVSVNWIWNRIRKTDNMPGDVMDAPVSGAQLAAAAKDAEKDELALQATPPPAHTERDPAAHILEHLHEELEDFPSEEDILTLRRVADHIPLKLFTIAFVELCERFSYYGSTVVCKLKSSDVALWD